ncbi:MAG: hypothetical protein ACRD3Q_13810, partial [Terriglobales bacterium]
GFRCQLLRRRTTPERKGDYVNDKEAYELAKKVLGGKKGEEVGQWHLEEFQGGWLVVRERLIDEMMGATSLVIERESGQVLSLPSSVPTRLITQQWERARQRARILPLPSVHTD